MKTVTSTVILITLSVILLPYISCHNKRQAIPKYGNRVSRQTSSDLMVQNILQWLQQVYDYNIRKTRQGSIREYLPPVHTQKPRPFEPPQSTPGGYPPAGSVTPNPPFLEPPHHGPPGTKPPSSTSPPEVEPSTGYPSGGPSTSSPSEGPSTDFPNEGPSTEKPSEGGSSTGGEQPEGPSTGYPGPENPSTSSPDGGDSPGSSPSEPDGQPTEGGSEGSGSSTSTSEPGETTDENVIPSENPDKPIDGAGSENEDDSKHPPHIHSIDVECSKEMMTINLEFNREFNGIIYSKGHFNKPECRYVQENSGQKKYSFTVMLNSCGTEFVNAFDTQGQSYLENILVIQNEAGIQEVWDTIRAVRCLWEGNLKKALNLTLSVGMLNQEIVTFSGDTAMAKLDIQMGKGPFAPPANGLIKIGELMTLVVSVTGDPGFDIQVKDCRAVDSSGNNEVALTDDQGCVVKPKVFGAFQKTRNTGDTGASIIAYAFFSAFKFPDIMDLTIECNVDLCKTDCEMCPDTNQKTDPGSRRKRELSYRHNRTEDDESIKMGKLLRVIVPEDFSDNIPFINVKYNEGICLSTQSFILFSCLLILLLCISSLFSTYIWFKYQKIVGKV